MQVVVMSFMSRLFPSVRSEISPARLAKIDAQIESRLKPVYEISTAILKAAVVIRDEAKCFIQDQPDGSRDREIGLFFESIYFFRHMALNAARQLLRGSSLKLLVDQLDPLLASSALCSYFKIERFPDELRDKLVRGFFDNLKAAEAEYAEIECSRCIPADPARGLAELRGDVTHLLHVRLVRILSAQLSETKDRSPELIFITTRALATFVDCGVAEAVTRVARVHLSPVDPDALLRRLTTGE
jgi:hypothetical protein